MAMHFAISLRFLDSPRIHLVLLYCKRKQILLTGCDANERCRDMGIKLRLKTLNRFILVWLSKSMLFG